MIKYRYQQEVFGVPRLSSSNSVESASSGNFTSSSNSSVLVTNQSQSIYTNGNPVMMLLQPDGSSNTSWISSTGHNGSGIQQITLKILRDGADIGDFTIGVENSADVARDLTFYIPTQLIHIDIPPAGLHTYSLYGLTPQGSFNIAYCNLLIVELT